MSSVSSYFSCKNRSFGCLILQIGVSYLIILMYYLNYEHWFIVQTVLQFTARRYSSRYFPTSANELVSP